MKLRSSASICLRHEAFVPANGQHVLDTDDLLTEEQTVAVEVVGGPALERGLAELESHATRLKDRDNLGAAVAAWRRRRCSPGRKLRQGRRQSSAAYGE